jgi:hypothetical protein
MSSNKDETNPQSQPPHSLKESITNVDSIESEPNGCSQSTHKEEKKSY